MLIGVVFVIIFLSVLILVHEFGHFLAAKRFGLLVEEFGFGLPPKIFGKKFGETDYSINALPFGGFVKIFGENREENLSVSLERNFSNLKIWKRAIILIAGVGFNFLLGWVAISLVFAIGTPSIVVITEIKKNSPAEEIGLLAGDRVIGFEGVGDFIDFVNQHQGEKINMEIERGEKILKFEAVPRKNPPMSEGALGVGLIDAGLPKQNIFLSFWEGWKTAVDSVKMIFLAIMNLIGKAVIGKASFEQVAGPIGIVKMTAQASTLGFVYLLQLLALISLNLAVINILPFPALDGGRLLFLIIEKIKGSPLDQKFERIANGVGFAFLILLMIVITIKDIIKL